MKKTVFVLVVTLFATGKILPQSISSGPANHTNGKNHTAGFGANIPIGEFSKTHIAGTGLAYSWSHQRFGKMSNRPKKLIGFTADGGMAYYFGKRETVAGYDYRYGGYIYLHAFGGAVYNPCKKGNISLTAGPTMGIYNGDSHLGFGANLKGSYYMTERIAITPGLMYMKHAEANAFWVIFARVCYAF